MQYYFEERLTNSKLDKLRIIVLFNKYFYYQFICNFFNPYFISDLTVWKHFSHQLVLLMNFLLKYF